VNRTFSRRSLALAALSAAAIPGLAACAPGSLKAGAAEPAPEPELEYFPPPEVQTAATPRPRVDYMELPLRVTIPRLGVDAPVIAVGLTPQMAMDVPQRGDEIGWYEYSTRPGMKGNSILAGHLDWAGKPAVFQKLIDLKQGDPVAIRGADGQERSFKVDWNRQWPLVSAPIGAIFEPLEQSALTLITCGGRWNPSTQRYDTRIVVRASRVA
jgi:hypothetical protein